ncbi:unnamed protein product, partial [Ectocarpus sp. 13 AM-2016]
MHEAARGFGDISDDDPSVQNVRVNVRSQIASGLRGDTDDVIKK